MDRRLIAWRILTFVVLPIAVALEALLVYVGGGPVAGGIAEVVSGFAIDIGILVAARRKLAHQQQTEGTTQPPRQL